MDVDFFLKERMAFIKHYYDEAAAPFVETMRKIDAEEALTSHRHSIPIP